MAKSQLIKDVATNQITVEETLQRLLIITDDLNIVEMKEWIKGELNGYSNLEMLPDYRKKVGNRIIYSGINGSFQITNQPLPISFIPEEMRDVVLNPKIKESISSIEKTLLDESEIGVDLTSLAGAIYNKTGVQCYSIFQEYSLMSLSEITSNVKNKALLMLLDLEKEFGNLDSLDINDSDITEEKVKRIKNSVNEIFYDEISEEL
ncbi:hypothetical protein [Vagococcus sp. CY53-2]|uniref:AbiTii domain-containing protein n=1 Tax=Vagococcus sp. CY53-2 TaxID=2925780 RepID=UPI001F50E043|nr:hypothetical protein [Vagococcus sp. CY53-2]MCI0130022.1 hypothetical protein [Vagococcus sp. CY53-2]